MKRILKLGICLTFLALLGTGFSACNTMRGLGEDIEQAGDAIEDAAD